MDNETFRRQIATLNGQMIGNRVAQSFIIKTLKEQFPDGGIGPKFSLAIKAFSDAEQLELKPEHFSPAIDYLKEIAK